MCKSFIYKYNDQLDESQEERDRRKKMYTKKINEFAEQIAKNYAKGKRVLIITGSGISGNVPKMTDIMNKIEKLISEINWQKSDVFLRIYEEYKNASKTELHQMQSQLLTYIQNAYLRRDHYVQKQDLKPLEDLWSQLVLWLLKGEGDNGLINAVSMNNHDKIAQMYRKMNAISITTNFDNLLSKSFSDEENFYPILDSVAFDKYFVNEENDNSYVEIQSRGDAFWVECTGEKNKTCPNKHRQCYVPGKNIEIVDGKIICNLCKSEAKIYFAFPGTKEKDAEMSNVMNGVWKYLGNTISSIIVIGNSMDYDPVLVEFVREITEKRNVPVMYISRYKQGCGNKDVNEKKATKLLFGHQNHFNNIWARSENTEDVLEDLLVSFNDIREGYILKTYEADKLESVTKGFQDYVDKIFKKDEKIEFLVAHLKNLNPCYEKIFNDAQVNRMKHFSQLGLKTFWLCGENSEYKKHNRYKHSVGVMLIASYLYLKISKSPNEKELIFLGMAALLHDIGHLPFSHLLEEVFDEFGWVPVGENTTFNHEQHTKKIIEKMAYEDSPLLEILNEIGYTKEELQLLINGEFGKGYLDALINSPIDCDKIEYLFTDAIFMNRGVKEDFDIFMQEYLSGISANKDNFLIIKEEATSAFLRLIRMRGEMYDKVYLRSGLRFLESCCKLIIRTFIAYKCTEEEMFKMVDKQSDYKEFYNLSEVKIDYVIKYMEKCLENLNENEVCELQVLRSMKEEIEKNTVISSDMKKTISNCFSIIETTKGDKAIKRLEADRIITYEVSGDKTNNKRLKDMLKNVYLRFPGTILVDLVESKSSFSFGKREMRARRSDGTKSATENILIKDIRQMKGHNEIEFKCLGDSADDVNKELHYPSHKYINIYRITDDSFKYMQAKDYVVHALKKEGVINEN